MSIAKMTDFLKNELPLIQFENRYLTKDKELIWLLWNARRDTETGLIYCSARNITSAKNRELRLQMMESAIENSKECVLITDTAGLAAPFPKIIYCNQAFTDLTGYAKEEVIRKTPRILQGPDTNRHMAKNS